MQNNNMNLVWAIMIIAVLFTLTACSTQPNFTQEEVEEAILALENKALGYWSAANPAKFSENFSDDASYFDDIAAHTRLDGIEELQKHFNSLEGAFPPHKYELADTRVQSFGNTAILTFRYHSSIDGQPGPPWKATSVYHYDNEKWKVVHAHWSLVKEQ